MFFADLISITVLPLVISSLILYFKTSEVAFLQIFLGAMLVLSFVELCKQSLVYLYPNWDVLYRPKKATNCGFFNEEIDNKIGFPSGHAAAATFMALVLLKKFKVKNPKIIALSVAYILLVAWSRVEKS